MHRFRVIRLNEAEYWNIELPEGCIAAYGLYVFKEGEATHLCSLTPSSFCAFIGNDFEGLYNEHPFVEENLNAGDDMYREFISDFDKPWISKAIEIAEDTEEDPQEDSDNAWEQAIEYFQGNYANFPSGVLS